ncbi:restriction endonuclease subunit S [Spirulina sp. CCNP1310]|uniref:restriction endonuclease subunit S n=1 Tax=Spirulina sp. CCNP1310 TaxID=3110249 RepID=UPI002B1ECFF0|nr:restriction endonuclease subunit S [Spirulina sp. CCNP1310]MEA5419294.1 restriction endonuclease subunit S [Spirulina sp. CCNP1310]
MKFYRYQTYKQSGIPWLYKIPEHWQVKRAKSIFKKMSRSVSDQDKIITVFRDGEVTLRENRRETGFTNAFEEMGYQGLKKGDLVFHAMDAFAGAIGVSDSDGKATPEYLVYTPIDKSKIYIPFYGLLFRQMALSGFVLALGKSVRERSPRFKHTKFMTLDVPIPPVEEQKEIAHYLDTKTAQIDRKIDLLTQKAQRYEELKRAIVNETVTRGLDKSVPMKDSGIDWIGEVSEHWEVKRLKDIACQSKEKNGNNPIGEMLSVSGYRGIEFKKYDDELKKRTNDELSDYRVVRPGQLVVNTMWLNYRGIGVSKLRGYVSPAYRAYFLNKTTYGNFIHYLMRSDLYVFGYSKYLQGIRPNSLQMKTIDFECLPMLVPPLPEQKAIAHYLDTKTAQIDQIIQTINTQIEKLKELRKTLINDIVTGKIKVA